MNEVEKCKSEGAVTSEFIEGSLIKNTGVSPQVTRMLVGMIARGDGFKNAKKNPPPLIDDDSEGE